MKKFTVIILLLFFAGCTSDKKDTTAGSKKSDEKTETVKKGSVPAAESSGDLCQGDSCPGAVR